MMCPKKTDFREIQKIHSRIPAPNSKTLTEKLGLDEVALKISLSEEAGDMVENVRDTIQTETRKTRNVLIILGVLNAISFLIGKYAI